MTAPARPAEGLGPARALRATERPADAALMALGPLSALAAQALGWALWLPRRALRPRPARRRGWAPA